MFRDLRKFRDSSAGCAIARHGAEENLRTDAYADSSKTHEEKIDCSEVSNAEAYRVTGEIAITEEKISRESDAIFESFGFGQEKEIVAESNAGIFRESIEQKKETQEFADADAIA